MPHEQSLVRSTTIPMSLDNFPSGKSNENVARIKKMSLASTVCTEIDETGRHGGEPQQKGVKKQE